VAAFANVRILPPPSISKAVFTTLYLSERLRRLISILIIRIAGQPFDLGFSPRAAIEPAASFESDSIMHTANRSSSSAFWKSKTRAQRPPHSPFRRRCVADLIRLSNFFEPQLNDAVAKSRSMLVTAVTRERVRVLRPIDNDRQSSLPAR
jgi:hypothetical protein